MVCEAYGARSGDVLGELVETPHDLKQVAAEPPLHHDLRRLAFTRVAHVLDVRTRYERFGVFPKE